MLLVTHAGLAVIAMEPVVLRTAVAIHEPSKKAPPTQR